MHLVGALDRCSMSTQTRPAFCSCCTATLPVTMAERLFSKMECTLTAIHNSTEEERLEALLLLQVHRQDTPTVDSAISARCLKYVV